MVDIFFNTESDRDLWLKLCAERQIEWEKHLTFFDKESQTYKPTLQALNARSMDKALQIARNQLDHDIQKGELRITLDDFLTKDFEGIEAIRQQHHDEWVQKLEN